MSEEKWIVKTEIRSYSTWDLMSKKEKKMFIFFCGLILVPSMILIVLGWAGKI